MTAAEAIARLDELKPNGFSYEQKLGWLAALDGTVKREIHDRHEGAEDRELPGRYEAGTVLLVPFPYEEIYLRYMEAQIDYANGEYERFNNSSAMYAAAWSAYERFYNRSHMPLGERKRYF